MAVAVSKSFRTKTIWAALAIVLFIVTYLTLFALVIGLTLLSGFVGILLLGLIGINYFTLILAFGCITMGGLVLYFLIKFLFRKHKVDRSHLTELTRESQPELFAMIADIVQQTGTSFPKNIYLDADVNAGVSYDSSFWSMFFPVRKNLTIGLGLVNSVTRLELKAILAHEFGHFSQRSMKLGSYVYNSNQVIYNMLFDNQSYQEVLQRWANISNILYIFASMSASTVQGIQWVLRKNYQLLNLSYLGLSREMEFHADAVAAHVAGSQPMISSLLRTEMADSAMQSVFGYYNQRINECVTTKNLYSQQTIVMGILAEAGGMPVVNGIPQVSEEEQAKFSHSKLVIKNQWASHPSSKDRIAALRVLNLLRERETGESANTLLRDVAALQERLSGNIFTTITYAQPVTEETDEQFAHNFREADFSLTFPAIFEGYYDRWNPGYEAGENLAADAPEVTFASLFNEERIGLVHTIHTMESDKQVLDTLMAGGHDIKTFDYDGIKYKTRDAAALATRLEVEIKELREQAMRHDQAILRHFNQLAVRQGTLPQWQALLETYAESERTYESRIVSYQKVSESAAFMRETTPYHIIEQNLVAVSDAESDLKAHIRTLLGSPHFLRALTPDVQELYHSYVSETWTYFESTRYVEAALEKFNTVMQQYPAAVAKSFLFAKLALLDEAAAMQQAAIASPSFS